MHVRWLRGLLVCSMLALAGCTGDGGESGGGGTGSGYGSTTNPEHLRQSIQRAMAGTKPFPFDFDLTDTTGKPLKLADFQGKVCIVDLWGTWCPPCRAEIPSFIKLQNELGSKGFQMIGLNSERAATPQGRLDLVNNFIKSQGVNYPCALVDNATLDQVPDLEGFPTTLFLDRTGKVRLRFVGLHPYEELRAAVDALLAESDPNTTASH